jgi:hypothetical protein
MIKVIITGPSRDGRFPYRIEGWPHLVGLSRTPLFEACRLLQAEGVATDTPAGLFDENEYRNPCRLKTKVGIGAASTVSETRRGRVVFRKYEPVPDEFKGRRNGPGRPLHALKSEGG